MTAAAEDSVIYCVNNTLFEHDQKEASHIALKVGKWLAHKSL